MWPLNGWIKTKNPTEQRVFWGEGVLLTKRTFWVPLLEPLPNVALEKGNVRSIFEYRFLSSHLLGVCSSTGVSCVESGRPCGGKTVWMNFNGPTFAFYELNEALCFSLLQPKAPLAKASRYFVAKQASLQTKRVPRKDRVNSWRIHI